MLYPTGLESNVRFRWQLHKDCAEDKQFASAVNTMCSGDPIYWVNVFAMTKDPRKTPSDIPFICYDSYQTKFILDIIQAIKTGIDMLLEKSRDMGASWMVLYAFTWCWLYMDGADFRVGSRKEDYVDKLGDIDTLFEKIRFCLRYLPTWMLPEGFDWGKHSSYMRLINPVNNNSIIGESANENFATGGRRKAILLDEFAKWPVGVANACWTSTADVTKCRLVVSTPFGAGNKYAELAAGTKETIKKVTLHWTLHPEKSQGAYYLDGSGNQIPLDDFKRAFAAWKSGVKVRSPWYDKECLRRSDADVAQELDIDYLRSGAPFFDLVSLSHQKAWEPFVRKDPADRIPYGKFITVNVLKIDHKIEIRERPDGWLHVFELPASGYTYVLGGDPAEGLPKGDLSFAVIREKATRNVVATIRGQHKPEDFAEMQWLAQLYFNKAIIACENNYHGYSVNSDMDQLGAKLYYTKAYETPRGDVVTAKKGFTTNRKTRLPMLSQMDEEIRTGAAELRDPLIIKQCSTFVKPENNPQHPEADGDFHDDGVIAFAICGFVLRETPVRKDNATKQKQRARVHELQKQRRNGGFKYKKAV